MIDLPLIVESIHFIEYSSFYYYDYTKSAISTRTNSMRAHSEGTIFCLSTLVSDRSTDSTSVALGEHIFKEMASSKGNFA